MDADRQVEGRLRGEDELAERIEWPPCPYEISEAGESAAWIKGKEAAIRAFLAALSQPQAGEEEEAIDTSDDDRKHIASLRRNAKQVRLDGYHHGAAEIEGLADRLEHAWFAQPESNEEQGE